MSRYEVTGSRIIAVWDHPFGGGTVHRELDEKESELVRVARKMALEQAAQMLEKLADDFAGEYGHDDMGALSFGQGSHAHEKMDKYTDMLDYAESIRAMAALT